MNLRENNIDKLNKDIFDVLIVGGGINGAVTAAVLSGHGIKTGLIEKGDFSSFTSQESSNLVWGGIKYLESFEFALVRKLCIARNHLIKNYPSTVKEIRFFTTIQKGFRHSRFSVFLGTLFYWAMGNFFTRAPRLLSTRKIDEEEGNIRTNNISGGFEYSDACLIDNDARFVFNFIRQALDHGGIIANYVESERTMRKNDFWITQARDKINSKKITIRSRVIVNACGAYADIYNQLSRQKTKHQHIFSKGIHLITRSVVKNNNRILAFFADDGRLFFIIPIGSKSCIGTTDTRIETLPPKITGEDRSFILNNINRLLKLEKPLTPRDIIAERCGVRPLVVERNNQKNSDGATWTSLSRKHQIETNKTERYITIFGGKLTDCINVGDEVLEIVHNLGIEVPYKDILWYGEPSRQIRNEFFLQANSMSLDDLTAEESQEKLSIRLWRRYGSRAMHLLEEIRSDPKMGQVLIKGTDFLRCEIFHAARHEMIVKLEDFLRRRSKIALTKRKEKLRNNPGLMETCKILFGRSAQKKFKEYFRGN